MIIFMSDVIVVTNRSLCVEPFLERVEKIVRGHPKAILLREKDLNKDAYGKLMKQVKDMADACGTLCICHHFADVARELSVNALHLSMPDLRSLSAEERTQFSILGASCHSLEEAREAQRLGCTYVTAGHIFDTDCKAGVPGRGLSFLEEICREISVPVYAIGGITADWMEHIKQCGASGGCVMSGAMQCEDVEGYLGAFR